MHLHPWSRGEGAFLFHFILSKIAILDKLNGTLRPPLPPKSVMGKWRVLAFTHLYPWFGGEGAFLFHFILSKIVVCPPNHNTCTALRRQTTTLRTPCLTLLRIVCGFFCVQQDYERKGNHESFLNVKSFSAGALIEDTVKWNESGLLNE